MLSTGDCGFFVIKSRVVTGAKECSNNRTIALISHASKVMLKILQARDFPGGPVVKTSPSNAEGVGSIPGQETKIPHAAWCSQVKNLLQSFSCVFNSP